MTKQFFPDAARVIAGVANEGTIIVTGAFASELRGSGMAISHTHDLDGTATVALEGAQAVAREFGTLHSPAHPVLSPALQARSRAIARNVGAHLGKAIKRK